MIVPARFEPEHVERNAARAKCRDLLEGLRCRVRERRTRHEPQPPFGRQGPSTAEQVVPAHRVERRRPGEHVHVHAAGGHERFDRVGARQVGPL